MASVTAAVMGALHISAHTLVVAKEANLGCTVCGGSLYGGFKAYKYCLKPIIGKTYDVIKDSCLYVRSSYHNWALERAERRTRNKTLARDQLGLSKIPIDQSTVALRNKCWLEGMKSSPAFYHEIVNGVLPPLERQGMGLHGERYVTQNGVPYKVTPVSSADGKVKYDLTVFDTKAQGEVAMAHWLAKVKVSAKEAPRHGVAIGLLRTGFSNVDKSAQVREFAAQGFLMSALTKDLEGRFHLLLVTNAHVALAVGSNIGLRSSIFATTPGVWYSFTGDWHYPFAGSEKNLQKLGGTVDDIAVCIVPHHWASDLGVTPLKASNLSFEQSGPVTFYTHTAEGTYSHSGNFIDGGNGVDGVATHNCSTGWGDSGALGYHSSKVVIHHFGGLPGHYNLAINAATLLQLMRMCHVVPTPTYALEVKAIEDARIASFTLEVKAHSNVGLGAAVVNTLYGTESNTQRGKQNARNQRTLFDKDTMYASADDARRDAYLQSTLNQWSDHTGLDQGTIDNRVLTKKGAKLVAAYERDNFKEEVAGGSGSDEHVAAPPPGLPARFTAFMLDPNDRSTNPTPFEELDFVQESVADPFQDIYRGPKITIPNVETVPVQEHVAVFIDEGLIAVKPTACVPEAIAAALEQPHIMQNILDACPLPIGKPIHLDALKSGNIWWDRTTPEVEDGEIAKGNLPKRCVSGTKVKLPNLKPPSSAPTTTVDPEWVLESIEAMLKENDLEGALIAAKSVSIDVWAGSKFAKELAIHTTHTGFKELNRKAHVPEDISSSIGAVPEDEEDEGTVMQDIVDESGRCVFKVVGRCTKQNNNKVPDGKNKKGEVENLKGRHLSQAFCDICNANRPGLTPMTPTSYYLPPENDEAVLSSLKTQAKRVGKGNLGHIPSETLDYAFDKMLGSSSKVRIENTMHTTFCNFLDSVDPSKSAGWSSVVLNGPKGAWKNCPNKLWRLVCLRALARMVYRGKIPTMTPLDMIKKGLRDPHVLSTKVEGHSEEKAEGGRWRNIWVSSMLDLAVSAITDLPLNKADVKAYQGGSVDSHFTNAVGIGHDSRGVRRLTQALENICKTADHDGERGVLTSEDASGWDMSVTLDDFLIAADLRVCSTYCDNEGVAEVTADLIYADAYCKAKHTVAIGGFLYEVQYYGIMPSGMLSTSCDNGKIRGFLSYACGAVKALAAGDDLVACGDKDEEMFNKAGKRTRDGAKTVDMFDRGVLEFNSHLLAIESYSHETQTAVWSFTRSEGSFSKILANCFLKSPRGLSQASANGIYSTLQGSPQAEVFAKVCAAMKWPTPVNDQTEYSDWDVMTECIHR